MLEQSSLESKEILFPSTMLSFWHFFFKKKKRNWLFCFIKFISVTPICFWYLDTDIYLFCMIGDWTLKNLAWLFGVSDSFQEIEGVKAPRVPCSSGSCFFFSFNGHWTRLLVNIEKKRSYRVKILHTNPEMMFVATKMTFVAFLKQPKNDWIGKSQNCSPDKFISRTSEKGYLRPGKERPLRLLNLTSFMNFFRYILILLVTFLYPFTFFFHIFMFLFLNQPSWYRSWKSEKLQYKTR